MSNQANKMLQKIVIEKKNIINLDEKLEMLLQKGKHQNDNRDLSTPIIVHRNLFFGTR